MDIIKQDMTDIWAVAGDVVAPESAKVRAGWAVEAVPRQWWNWFENRQDTNIAYMLQKGIPEWDQFTEYLTNKSYVQRNNIIYKCILTCTNQDPATATTYWTKAFVESAVALEALKVLTPAADKLPYYTGASTSAVTTFTAFARTLVDDVDAAAARTTLGAQLAATNLTSLSNVTPAVNVLPYFDSSTSMTGTTLTAFGRSLLAPVDAASARTTLSVYSAAEVDSAIAAGDATKQPLDATLTALAGIATGVNQLVYSTGTDTFAQTALTPFARTILDDVDAATARATLSAAKSGANTDITSLSGVTLNGVTALAGALNEAVVTLASAATVNIGAAAGNIILITGSTTITAFDTVVAGTRRTVYFGGGLTLTHNASVINLPTAANILTQSGDSAEMLSNGSGSWVCLGYNRFNGKAIGLGNVDNTSDVNKPVSTAQQAALDTKQNLLGFTPVQQGTGVGQTSNVVKLGWSAGSKLKLTIDTTDLGNVALEASPTFTGTPLVPTAAPGTNNTQAASTAFVAAAISAGTALQPGLMDWFATMTPPTGYLGANGAAVSRTTYAALFSAITVTATCSASSGTTTIGGFASTSSMWVGMPLSGTGIPAGATVVTVPNGTSITISANTNATVTSVVICPFGVGDGSTTFNVPDGRGVAARGWDNGRGLNANRVFGSYEADGLGSHGHTINDPSHFHAQTNATQGTAYTAGGVFGALAGGGNTGSKQTGITINNTGGVETVMKNIALLACIKY